VSTPKKNARKPKSWTYWMGFCNGKPFLFRHEFEFNADPRTTETVLSVNANRAELRTRYEDVRRVRITEVLLSPARSARSD